MGADISLLLQHTRNINDLLTQNQNSIAIDAQFVMTGFQKLIADADYHPQNLIRVASIENLANIFHDKILPVIAQMHTFPSPFASPSSPPSPPSRAAVQSPEAPSLTVEMVQAAKGQEGAIFELWYPQVVTISDVWEAWTVGLKGIFPRVIVMEAKGWEYVNWRASSLEHEDDIKFKRLKVIVEAIGLYKNEECWVELIENLQTELKTLPRCHARASCRCRRKCQKRDVNI